MDPGTAQREDRSLRGPQSQASTTALAQAWEAVRLADTDPRRAAPVAAQAVRSARRERDPRAVAVAERAWGHSLLQRGDLDAGIDHLRRSVAYGRRAGSASLVEFQVALPALRAASDELGVARMLVNRGILHAYRHAFTAAVKDLREAEVLSRRLGRPLAVGIIAENLGFVETLRGDVPAALAHLDRAEQIIGTHGGQVAPVRYDRGVLLLSVGLAAEARQAAELAVTAFQREGRHLKVPEARLLLAQAAAVAGDWATATAHARQAMHELGRQRRAEWAALARLVTLQAGLASGDRVDRRNVPAMVRTLAGAGWPAAAVEAQPGAAEDPRPCGPAAGTPRHCCGSAATTPPARSARSGPACGSSTSTAPRSGRWTYESTRPRTGAS